MKKLSPKKQVQLCISFVWIGAVVAMLSKMLGTWCLWVGFGIVVVAGICRYTLIRCPHCGYKLVEGNSVPRRCPKCEGDLHT